MLEIDDDIYAVSISSIVNIANFWQFFIPYKFSKFFEEFIPVHLIRYFRDNDGVFACLAFLNTTFCADS